MYNRKKLFKITHTQDDMTTNSRDQVNVNYPQSVLKYFTAF